MKDLSPEPAKQIGDSTDEGGPNEAVHDLVQVTSPSTTVPGRRVRPSSLDHNLEKSRPGEALDMVKAVDLASRSAGPFFRGEI